MALQTFNFHFDGGCSTCHKSLIVAPANGGCGCNYIPAPPPTTIANSPCVECEDPCEDLIPTDCQLYSGADIPQLGIKNGDLLTKVIVILAAEVLSSKAKIVQLEQQLNP